jgi:hypothetical protein
MKSPHDEQVFPHVRVINVESRKLEAAMTQIPADFPVIREFRTGPESGSSVTASTAIQSWKSSYFSGQSANLREMPAFRAGSEPGKGLENERP